MEIAGYYIEKTIGGGQNCELTHKFHFHVLYLSLT